MNILDGKKVSNEIIENIKYIIEKDNLKLKFAIIQIGNKEESNIYVKNKMKKCNYVGIEPILYHLDNDVLEKDVLELIDKLNNDKDINGILLQSPVPKHIDIINCFNKVDYKKDIDGFSNISVGNLYLNKPGLRSCTPKGIIRLLDYYKIPIEGKNVCIINRSNIVGKPLFHLLIERNATVTLCHSKTKELENITKNADILISAVGKANFIKENMVKDGAVVIDVGISRENDKIVGDVDFENVQKKASYISPVPGGVGPMTIAMILENILNTTKEE